MKKDFTVASSSILDCSRWPHDDENLSSYGENEVSELCEHFDEVLSDNGCDISKVSSEWDLLKLEVNSITAGMNSVNYLDVWSRIFSEKNIRESCKNSLHIIELLLITPTTNAKIERMFSRMNRVKTDWRNRLSRDRLEHNLRIGEEGPCVQDFSPDEAVARWYNEKVRRFNGAKPHKYPEKRHKTGQSSKAIDVVQYCISDFESDSDDEL